MSPPLVAAEGGDIRVNSRPFAVLARALLSLTEKPHGGIVNTGVPGRLSLVCGASQCELLEFLIIQDRDSA